MEASGSVLVDQGMYPKRSSSCSPAFGSNNGSSGGGGHGFLRRSATQQLLLNCWGTLPPPYASTPLPVPIYSSLPPPHLLQQTCPPLLPLPLSRSFSLPSPAPPVSARRRVMGAATARKDQKKPRSSPANSTRCPQPGGVRPHREPPARAPKSTACAFMQEGDVYALSPPPSSLPMPRFSLRARTPSPSSSSSSSSSSPPSSCNAEAFGRRSW